MNIVFMGTPDFAVPSLKALIAANHSISAVFTQPDKQKGRGHHMAYPPIKQIAIEHNIEVIQPKTLKDESVQARLRELSPELIVVVAYGRILQRSVLELPKYGCINVHASLLPKFRGAGPIQWSVLSGEKITGVTTMYMADGIDTGDMLLKSQTEIDENETASELHDRLSEMGASLLIETIDCLEKGTLSRIPQNDSEATHAPMLTKEQSPLDFTKTATELHCQIRGLSGWPCAEACFNGKRLKVHKSELCEPHSGNSGDIIDTKSFIVCCGGNTAIKLTEVQPEGGKRMSGADFLRGQRIDGEWKLT